MSNDHFEATFTLGIDRPAAWRRLTEHPVDATEGTERCWLPGFDAAATVTDRHDGTRLRLIKDDEPCKGTDIVVTLTDADDGTRITVSSRGSATGCRPATT